ncbi:hypothetical protein COB21_04625 [Candidatus Aerophobetes bacterium]|uniref:Spermatogenesis-associated protein 20-like TRX domain-containing protein n=1 Tax=Aerophobetes bacterium TaxID=2030807 RepID=A0A2A4X169_UNCAE|nr:MAG: hypothetical protein COB21_04625 [Candidatus Aerophobetes bacterium]
MGMDLPYFDDLSSSNSPYLNEHINALVPWHTWSRKAINLAIKHSKPLFVSMGFASSYMCMKMNKECFLDPEIAKILRDNFVCIKVDKDENHLIHHYLLNMAQMLIPHDLTWPINLFLTPELMPFFGVSYLPKNSVGEQGGMLDVLKEVAILYQEDRDTVTAQGRKMVNFYSTEVVPPKPQALAPIDHADITDKIFSMVDPLLAGIKHSCKFPLSFQSLYLLHYGKKAEDLRSFFFLQQTFEKMRHSNITDNLYGGYFSFTHDEQWSKPYFEKSLIVNTMIAKGLLAAASTTGDKALIKDCENTLAFILSNLKIEGQGFASTQYSLKEDRLGDSYMLSKDFVDKTLAGEDLDIFTSYFSVTHIGNSQGKNLLASTRSISQWASDDGSDPLSTQCSLQKSLETIKNGMQEKNPPSLDTRQFLSNCSHVALLLFEAGQFLKRKDLITQAYDTLEFIDSHLKSKNYFYQYYNGDKAHNLAGLEDLSAYLNTLLSIFQQSNDSLYWKRATGVISAINTHFYQGSNGLYFCKNTPLSIDIPIFFEDLTQPSAQALQAHNALMLYQISSDESYLKQGRNIIASLQKIASENPWSYTYLLYVASLYEDMDKELKVSTDHAQSLA